MIRRTLALAAQHKVEIGAHPSYHDLQGCPTLHHHTPDDQALMLYQLGALEGMCRSEGLVVSYVLAPSTTT